MKTGLNLINFGPAADPGRLRGWVEVAEGIGFHSLLTSDHIVTTDDVNGRYPAPFYEPLSTLGWLAGATTSILIGTTVIVVPYRHPLETARALAGIDQLSGGRLIFGIGSGWAEREFEILGVPFDERGPITDEYVDVMRRFWSGDSFSHEGEFVSFGVVHTTPRPVQTPHPPIWVGGSSPAALRRTVELDASWHPIRIRPSWLVDKGLPSLDAAAARRSKDRPPVCPRIGFRLTDQPVPEDRRLMGEGTIDQLHADLNQLEALGCDHVILDTSYDGIEGTLDPEGAWRDLERVAAEVLDLPNETTR
ncbi:MAG: TIGR03619 family F420-dependent LLM class oxidoreductase [Actinomycetia bacterium]|nr:TIGR03619 family F420-dependent LLM class oxidoreductase [Actinomycetes bacterium]